MGFAFAPFTVFNRPHTIRNYWHVTGTCGAAQLRASLLNLSSGATLSSHTRYTQRSRSYGKRRLDGAALWAVWFWQRSRSKLPEQGQSAVLSCSVLSSRAVGFHLLSLSLAPVCVCGLVKVNPLPSPSRPMIISRAAHHWQTGQASSFWGDPRRPTRIPQFCVELQFTPSIPPPVWPEIPIAHTSTQPNPTCQSTQSPTPASQF